MLKVLMGCSLSDYGCLTNSQAPALMYVCKCVLGGVGGSKDNNTRVQRAHFH